MENIIYVAAPRDWFDYISSILTFAFSLVAIIIAVSTARRQNRIAMLEKRYSVYKIFNNYLYLADFIDEHITYATFIHVYNLMFSTNFEPDDKTRNTILEVMKRTKQINEEASQIVFLYNFISESVIQELINCFNALLMKLTESEEASSESVAYKASIQSFNSQYREKIEACLCLEASSRSKKFNSLI